MKTCDHQNFDCCVNVNRITETEGGPVVRFTADVTVRCLDCGTPFRFIGLPAGIDLNSPTVSVTGEEGRFPIGPRGEVLCVLDAPSFTVRRTL